MSKIEDIVDALENKISKVLHKQEVLKPTNAKLYEQLEQNQHKLLEKHEEILGLLRKTRIRVTYDPNHSTSCIATSLSSGKRTPPK